MHDAGTFKELVERNEIKSLTAEGGWKEHWNHWGGRGCLNTEVPHDNLDMPYIRCEEEGGYVKRLGDLIGFMDEDVREDRTHLHCSFLRFPYDDLWFIHLHYYWWRDLDFEPRMRHHGHFSVFAGWHSTELFSIPASECSSYYFIVPDWWESIEVSSIISVPSPIVPSYYSNRVLHGTARKADTAYCKFGMGGNEYLVFLGRLPRWICLFQCWTGSACVEWRYYCAVFASIGVISRTVLLLSDLLSDSVRCKIFLSRLFESPRGWLESP